MVVKMRCRDVNGHIIRRMLYRSKGINLLTHRQHNYTTRMLSRSTSNTDTALHYPVYLAISLSDTALLIIVFNVSKCGLVSKCTYGSGFKGLALSENNLGIFVCL